MGISATSSLLSIGGGIIYNILIFIGIGLGAVALYFLTRWIQKNSKKQKAFNINAIIVDMNGVIEFDTIALVKSDVSGLLEMIFKIRKNDSIPPIPKHLIKNGNVLLLNYAPGHYCVIDTSETIRNLGDNKYDIVPFNLGMKKYITSKHRDILNKQEKKRKNFELYAPWITLGVGILADVILAVILFLLGVHLDQQNLNLRVQECLKIIGR